MPAITNVSSTFRASVPLRSKVQVKKATADVYAALIDEKVGTSAYARTHVRPAAARHPLRLFA